MGYGNSSKWRIHKGIETYDRNFFSVPIQELLPKQPSKKPQEPEAQKGLSPLKTDRLVVQAIYRGRTWRKTRTPIHIN
jgi:hypothetical protein